MARATAQVKSKVKKKPVKAGSTAPRNIGGAVNAKLVATVKKIKNG